MQRIVVFGLVFLRRKSGFRRHLVQISEAAFADYEDDA
jgi:hypothetical protein